MTEEGQKSRPVKYGFSGKPNFRELADILNNGWYEIMTVLGTVIFSISTAFIGDFTWPYFAWPVDFIYTASVTIKNPWIYTAIGVSLFAYGSRGAYFDKQNLNQLSEYKTMYNDELEQNSNLIAQILKLNQEWSETWLTGVFKQLKLSTHERVTIYYEYQEEFYLLSRFSLNPRLSKRHRDKFPLSQGVISKAWEYSEHQDFDVPVVKDTEDEYLNYMNQKYDYERTLVQNLTMKSCEYYAKAITDADRHVGVFLVESECRGGLVTKVNEIKSLFSEYETYMAKFIRDAIKYDLTLKSSATKQTPEEDFLNMMYKQRKA